MGLIITPNNKVLSNTNKIITENKQPYNGTWYDNFDISTFDNLTALGGTTFTFSNNISLPTGKLCKIKIFINSCDLLGTNVKIGVYNSSLNLVANSINYISFYDTGSYKEFDMGKIQIQNGTHRIMFMSERSQVVTKVKTVPNVLYYNFATYSSFPTPTRNGADAITIDGLMAFSVLMQT